MKTCKSCYHPATSKGLCPYHGGRSIRGELKRRGISRKEFKALLGGASDRTIDRIHNGERQLSELELRGLLTVNNKEK